MSSDIKITFAISDYIKFLPLVGRNQIYEILEPIAESFFSYFSPLRLRCFDLKFQYSYFFNGEAQSIIATLSHVPKSDFSGSVIDKEKLIDIAKNFIVLESEKYNLSVDVTKIGISNLIFIRDIEYCNVEDKPSDLLVVANSFFYIHINPINEVCERDFFKKKIRATFTPTLNLQAKKAFSETAFSVLNQLEQHQYTHAFLFNRHAPTSTGKLYETVISFAMVFSRKADFGCNMGRNKFIETIIPVMILRIHEFLQSPILRFEIKLQRNENSNIIALPEIKVFLLTMREYKIETDLDEITACIMECFSRLNNPSNNLPALLGIPLKMQPLITKELAFYTECLQVNVMSIPCIDHEIIASVHPVSIATHPNRIGAVVKIEYEFVVARKQSSQDQAVHNTSVIIDARKPTDNISNRNIFGELVQQTFFPSKKPIIQQLVQAQTPSIATLPILMKQKVPTTSIDASAKDEETILNELLSGKYKNDKPIERKLHIEKAIRNATHHGCADDLKLFLKFKDKLSINVDGVAGNSNLKTALHYAVSRSTDQHVECAKLLLEAGARLDRQDEKGATAEDIILLKTNPAMEELRNKFSCRESLRM